MEGIGVLMENVLIENVSNLDLKFCQVNKKLFVIWHYETNFFQKLSAVLGFAGFKVAVIC